MIEVIKDNETKINMKTSKVDKTYFIFVRANKPDKTKKNIEIKWNNVSDPSLYEKIVVKKERPKNKLINLFIRAKQTLIFNSINKD